MNNYPEYVFPVEDSSKYDRPTEELSEEILLRILNLPDYNVSKKDAVRLGIKRIRVNKELKAKAEKVLSNKDTLSTIDFIWGCNALIWDFIVAVR